MLSPHIVQFVLGVPTCLMRLPTNTRLGSLCSIRCHITFTVGQCHWVCTQCSHHNLLCSCTCPSCHCVLVMQSRVDHNVHRPVKLLQALRNWDEDRLPSAYSSHSLKILPCMEWYLWRWYRFSFFSETSFIWSCSSWASLCSSGTRQYIERHLAPTCPAVDPPMPPFNVIIGSGGTHENTPCIYADWPHWAAHPRHVHVLHQGDELRLPPAVSWRPQECVPPAGRAAPTPSSQTCELCHVSCKPPVKTKTFLMYKTRISIYLIYK